MTNSILCCSLVWPAAFGLVSISLMGSEPSPDHIPSGQITPPTTHREAALMLIGLLQQTQSCLASCTDAASVRAALPQLRLLARQIHSFKEMQEHLPEPTTQDYIAAQNLTGDFNTAWNAIREHIERLENAQLMTQELSELLGIETSPSRLP